MEEELVARRAERRQSRSLFLALERRTGFERRGLAAGRLLTTLRDSPTILLTLLVAINVMNVLDLLFTVGALEAGYAEEGNPLMAFMFSRGVPVAAGFKFVCVAAVTIVIWRMRRYRRVLQVAVLAFILFSGVLLVHAYGLAFFQ